METSGKHVDRESEAFKKLKGLKKHFCPDWDYMAIDETTQEFEACCCEQYNPPKAPATCHRCAHEFAFYEESCPNCGFDGSDG
jgi:hypothetical protein